MMGQSLLLGPDTTHDSIPTASRIGWSKRQPPQPRALEERPAVTLAPQPQALKDQPKVRRLTQPQAHKDRPKVRRPPRPSGRASRWAVAELGICLQSHFTVESSGQGVHATLDLQPSGLDLFRSGVPGNLHRALHAIAHSRERLRQNGPIPTLETPGPIGAPRDPGDG